MILFKLLLLFRSGGVEFRHLCVMFRMCEVKLGTECFITRFYITIPAQLLSEIKPEAIMGLKKRGVKKKVGDKNTFIFQ